MYTTLLLVACRDEPRSHEVDARPLSLLCWLHLTIISVLRWNIAQQAVALLTAALNLSLLRGMSDPHLECTRNSRLSPEQIVFLSKPRTYFSYCWSLAQCSGSSWSDHIAPWRLSVTERRVSSCANPIVSVQYRFVRPSPRPLLKYL